MPGTLFLVATPIGNLGDVSQRMHQTLEHCDFVAAEDTRVGGKLLSLIGLKKPMVSYYEHNQMTRGQEILNRLLAGENCALITDAGMPAISDPGEHIARLCIDHDVPVTVVPGPCAAVSALAVSGLPTGRFCFEGFLPVPSGPRKQRLEQLKTEQRTMILYEAPHKLLRTLQDLLAYLGDRRLTIARELTKLHEQIVYTSLSRALQLYVEQPPRGEFVLVLEGASASRQAADQAEQLELAVSAARRLMQSGLSQSEAARQAAEQYQVKKNQLYKRLLQQ